jgi:hypothetical protein
MIVMPGWMSRTVAATVTLWRYGKVSPYGLLSSGENETQASLPAKHSTAYKFTGRRGRSVSVQYDSVGEDRVSRLSRTA